MKSLKLMITSMLMAASFAGIASANNATRCIGWDCDPFPMRGHYVCVNSPCGKE